MCAKTLTRLVAALSLALAGAETLWADAADDQFAIAASHYDRAQKSGLASDWKLAVEEFDAFLSQYPDHPRAAGVHFYSGEALVQLNRLDEARGRFEKFLQAAPEHKFARQAQFRLGETAYLTGRAEQAIESLQAFVEQHPQDPLCEFALPYLGELALARGDAARAEKAYSQSLRDFQRGRLAEASRLGLARASEELGALDDAERFYRFVADGASARLASEARYRLGAMKFRKGEHAEAERLLADMAARDAQSPWRPFAQYWQARAQMEQGRWQEANGTLEKIGSIDDPSLAPAIEFAAGQTLARLERREAAAERLEKALDRWPQSEWADDCLQTLAELTLQSGDHERLEKLAATFSEQFPESPLRPLVRRAWGRSLLKREQFQEAKEVFTELVSPAMADAAKAVDWHCLGLAHLGEGGYDEALAALDKARGGEAGAELRDAIALARATALIGLKRWEEAIEPLRAHLDSQPQGPDAPLCRARLVWCLAETGKIDEAAAEHEALTQLKAAPPGLAPATRRLAQAAQSRGRGELAKRLWESLASGAASAEEKAESLASLAWMAWESEDFSSAAAAFERLAAEHPESGLAAEAIYMRGRCLERAGEIDRALALYEQAANEHAAARHAGHALLAAARLHEEKGDKARAAELLARLVEERPNDPQADAAMCQRAWLLLDLGQADEAMTILDQIVRQRRESPYWADAAYRVAERAAATGDVQRAETLLKEITQSAAERPAGATDEVLAHALYLQGQLAAGAERWSEAMAPMRRLIDQAPESSLRLPAEFWLAESHYRLGQYDEAADRFASLAERTADGQAPWMATIALRHAQMLAHQEKWPEALESASRIAERFPDFRQQYEADYVLGRCLASQARLDDARAAYERVVRSPAGGRTETAAMAQWMIGETHLHQKNYHEAIKAYFRVERLFAYPHWQAAALLQAGKCYEAQGAWPDAARLYAQLLREHPGTQFEQEAAQRLERRKPASSANAAPPTDN